MSQKPLTDEQIWGVPAEEGEKVESSANYCPYKEIECSAWDHGCQAEICILEAD